jgi:type III pantothenate kinase
LRRLKSKSGSQNIWYLNFGNTNINAWNGNKKILVFRTKNFRAINFFLKAKDIDEVWIASVVPKLSSTFIRECEKRAIEVHNIGAKDIPISPAYSETLGIDRLLNVFAASKLLDHAKKATAGIVVDLGTAMTIDVFRRRKHLGGWILPGLYLMSESLFKKTALLPRIEISKKDFGLGLGRSTRESIAAGQVHLLKGLVDQARNLLNERADAIKIYLTGGKAKQVRLKAKEIPLLTLKGLKLIRDRKRGRS